MTHDEPSYTPQDFMEAGARLAELVTRMESIPALNGSPLLAEAETGAEELRVAAEEVQTSQERLSIERERWAALFDFAPDGYVVSDEHGLITTSNRAICEMLKIDNDRMQGKPLAVFVDEAERRTFRSAVSTLVSFGTLDEMTIHLRSRAGERIPVVIRASVLPAKPREVQWSIRDVSEQYWVRQRVRNLEHGVQLMNEISLLHSHLSADRSLTAVLNDVVALVSRGLPGYCVALTLYDQPERRDSVPVLQAWTDERSRSVASTILSARHGPLFLALESGEPVSSENVAHDERWPDLLLPHVSVLSLPLQAGTTTYGTMCLYAFEEAENPVDIELAQQLADHAATLLDNVRSYGRSVDETDNLREAMKTRAVIEQAKGILMAMRRCTEEEAFAILRVASQRENRKLHDVAKEVVVRSTAEPGS